MKIFHFIHRGGKIYLNGHVFILASDETEARAALKQYLVSKHGDDDYSNDYRVKSVKDDHGPQLVVAFSGFCDE